jgi:hypothetical protein
MLIYAQLWRFLIHHVIIFVDATVGRNPVIGVNLLLASGQYSIFPEVLSPLFLPPGILEF